MRANAPDYAEVAVLIKAVSLLEQVRLVEEIMGAIRQNLTATPQPRRSLLDIWSDVSISAEEIDEARREMWGNHR